MMRLLLRDLICSSGISVTFKTCKSLSVRRKLSVRTIILHFIPFTVKEVQVILKGVDRFITNNLKRKVVAVADYLVTERERKRSPN